MAVRAQGQVNFANTPATFNDGIDRYVYVGGVGGTRLVGTNYAAALYWGTGVGPLDQFAVRALDNTSLGASVALFRDPGSSLAGTWSGGSRFFVGQDVGASLQLQVRVWDISRFATYQLAIAAGDVTGASEVFGYVVPSPLDAAGLSMNNLRAFGPLAPEPSTVVLGILGLGSLLLFRRKKA